MSAVTFELDHVFVMSSVGAPEGERLLRAGIPEGPPNTHPGQGTACRRFPLGNAYIELLWVRDEQEVRSEDVRMTQLWERWSGRSGEACPFGVVLRPSGEDVSPPFDTWEYRPAYLPSPLAIHVARDVPLTEPGFFYLPFQPDRARLGEPASRTGKAPATLTHVTFGGPQPARSPAARIVQAGGWFTTQPAAQHVMTLSLTGSRGGGVVDLRPGLPLVLAW